MTGTDATFEIKHKDLMGRTGRLALGDRRVATPALMPVVNPHYGVPDLDDARIAITNAHILMESDDHTQEVLDDGLHAFMDFDGPIVTDSGSYQLSVYGDDEVDATNAEVLEFQLDAGSDVVTPLDLPTDPDAAHDAAAEELDVTVDRIDEAVDVVGDDAALNAPVQGATYPDLRREAGERVRGLGADVYPIGGVVPLMQGYRFDDLVEVVMAAKEGLGPGVPVHLFGAGHPMAFGLAVAMGCDLFDSAAYALYADEGRYLTPTGTREADELHELPCACPVCADGDPDALAENFDRLADHNLAVSFAEMRRVRDAVRRGDLFEHLERRCRSHPDLLDGLRRLTEYVETLERYDPAAKRTTFYLGTARRPEVERHHERLDRIRVGDAVTVTTGSTMARHDGDEDNDGDDGDEAASDGHDVLLLDPPFGPHPPALRQTAPLNAETPSEPDEAGLRTALEGVERLAALNPDAAVTLEHPGWSHPMLDALADDGVAVVDISGDAEEAGGMDEEATSP